MRLEVLTRITCPAGQVRADGVWGQDCALFDDHEIFDGDEFALSSRKSNRERPNELEADSSWVMPTKRAETYDNAVILDLGPVAD
jgi:hypothetical protein